MNRRYSDIRPKPRPLTLMLVAGLHLLALYGLVWALAPGFTKSAHDSVLTAINIAEPPKKEKIVIPPAPEPVPDEGAAGAAGRKATPKELIVPKPKHTLSNKKKETPETPGQGQDSSSGKKDEGQGTGASGTGNGTGSGQRGSGGGGLVAATKPKVRAGEINTGRDFPTPPGGRKTRYGKSVTVQFTVTTDGRARNCSVARSSVDAAATSRVCSLVMQKIRFHPAKTSDGRPVEARYGYRVNFRGR